MLSGTSVFYILAALAGATLAQKGPHRIPILAVILSVMLTIFFLGAAQKTSAMPLPIVIPESTIPIDREDLVCLAKTIYFEARGEELQGRLAVAQVVVNRAASSSFPDSICDVVTHAKRPGKYNCQFTWYCDGKSDTPKDDDRYIESLILAIMVLEGKKADLIGSRVDHYHADYVSPSWAKKFTRVATIGSHIFYRKPTVL